jgi:hypothetical protein
MKISLKDAVVFAGIALMAWAAWQVKPTYGVFVIGCGIYIMGIR